MTLRRKATVTTGRTDATAPFDPALEYVAAPKDDASGLGCSGDGPCDGTQPPVFVCPVDSLVPVPAIQARAAAARWCRPASSNRNRPMPPAAW